MSRQREPVHNEDAETGGRQRAAELIRQGLTPLVVHDAMSNPATLEACCRRIGVEPQDVLWLADRWPLRTDRRQALRW